MLPPEAPLRVVAAYLCDGAHAFGAGPHGGAARADDALPGRGASYSPISRYSPIREVPGRGECPAPAPFTRFKMINPGIPRAKGPKVQCVQQ